MLVPPVVEALGLEGRGRRRRLTTSSKPAVGEQLLEPVAVGAARTARARSGSAARTARARTASRPITESHGLCVGRVPDGQRQPAAGAQDAARLAQRRLGVGQQHVAPAAEDAVDARRRTGRSTRPPSARTRRSRGRAPRRAPRAASTIASAPSVLISLPPGRRSSAARRPVSPGPAASSRTVWPGCGSTASTQPGRDPAAARCIASRVAAQPAAAPLPALAALGAEGLGVHRGAIIASVAAHELARGGARQGVGEATALGTLKPASRARAVRAQLVAVAARAVAQDDRRDDGLAPLRRPARPCTAASATAGWSASTASTSAGATFSPPVTIVSALRPVTTRRPSGADAPRSPVCSDRPARRARRSGRRRGSRRSPRVATRVQNSGDAGGGRPASRPR